MGVAKKYTNYINTKFILAKFIFRCFNNDMVQVDNNSNSKGKYIAKSALGIAVGGVGYTQALKYSTKSYSKYMDKYLKENASKYNDEFLSATQEFLESSSLKDKGVKIFHLSKEKNEEILNSYKNFFSNKFSKIKSEKLKNYLYNKRFNRIKSRQDVVMKGLNAYYTHSAKKKEVIVNAKKFAEAIPHELGHAQNFNSDEFLRKLLVRMRGQSKRLSFLVLLNGLLMPKREKGEKSNDIFLEGLNVIKEHSGLFTFVSMLPIVLEEGLASINASKMMKGRVSEEMLKHLNKTNLRAWGSYLNGAVLMSLCTSGAVFLRDKIAGKKPSAKNQIQTI